MSQDCVTVAPSKNAPANIFTQVKSSWQPYLLEKTMFPMSMTVSYSKHTSQRVISAKSALQQHRESHDKESDVGRK